MIAASELRPTQKPLLSYGMPFNQSLTPLQPRQVLQRVCNNSNQHGDPGGGMRVQHSSIDREGAHEFVVR
jgi:hypothetical protein